MSSEEMVMEIQSGKKEYIPLLWDKSKKLLFLIARRYTPLLLRTGMEWADIEQQCFLALSYAIKSFSPEKGKAFNSFLEYSLLSVCKISKWGRFFKAFPDHPRSLDECVEDGEKSRPIHEFIPDTDSLKSFEEVENREYLERLHYDLECSLHEIEPTPAEAIRKEYWRNLPLSNEEKKLKNEAIQQLQNPIARKRLLKYLPDVASFPVGFYKFMEKSASSVELAVEFKHKRENRYE